MATETKNFQIIQKTGADEYLVVHPETVDENVLISAEGIEADNLKEALVELKDQIDDAVAGGVTSVAGKTGAVTLTKSDVGLGNVDNTSDANKPVSTAQQAALDLKADKSALDDKADKTALEAKADTSYVDTELAKKVGQTEVNAAVEGKADKTYVDGELAKKANTSDIPDVSSFITKAVNDLTNYYTSSVIDGKVTDLESKISAIPKFTISVVSQLPGTGADATIYLVSNGGSESQNLYAEYIWTGSAFEKLGEQKLDLSGYVTTSALNSAIADFLKAGDVNGLITTALADYIKASAVSAIGKSGNLSDATDDATHRLVTDTEKSNWNSAKTTAEAAMPKAGGTFMGAVTLSGAPTADLHAATKKYVDDQVKTASTAAATAQSKAEEAKSAADDAQETADANATEIANIKSGTTKVGAATKADTATSATSATQLAASKNFSITGDVTAAAVGFNGTGNVALSATLADSGVTAGSYTAVTVDKKGRVTQGAAAFEVGTSGQTTPSANLAIGGLFFKLLN